jgi:hypothetical protein
MKYIFFAITLIFFFSCHDLHQKLYDTFHGKKKHVLKDSVVNNTIGMDSVISIKQLPKSQ